MHYIFLERKVLFISIGKDMVFVIAFLTTYMFSSLYPLYTGSGKKLRNLCYFFTNWGEGPPTHPRKVRSCKFFPEIFGHPPLFSQIFVSFHHKRDLPHTHTQNNTTKATNKSYRLFILYSLFCSLL